MFPFNSRTAEQGLLVLLVQSLTKWYNETRESFLAIKKLHGQIVMNTLFKLFHSLITKNLLNIGNRKYLQEWHLEHIY